MLVEDGDVVSDDEQIAKIFISYFNCITDNLNILEIPSLKVLDALDSVSFTIAKYASHPSILTLSFLEQLKIKKFPAVKLQGIARGR